MKQSEEVMGEIGDVLTRAAAEMVQLKARKTHLESGVKHILWLLNTEDITADQIRESLMDLLYGQAGKGRQAG